MNDRIIIVLGCAYSPVKNLKFIKENTMLRVGSIRLLSTLLLLSGCLSIDVKSPSKSFSVEQQLGTVCKCPANKGTVAVIHFKSDSSEILPEARQLIDENIAECIALRMIEDPSLKVLITGHTAKGGTREYNFDLGNRRALAVLDYLSDRVLGYLNDPELVFKEFEISSPKVTSESQQKTEVSNDDIQVLFSEDSLKGHFCTASKGNTEFFGNDTKEISARNRRVIIEFVRVCE